MKALVTGIAGFTGRYAVDALKARGLDVVGITHRPVDAHGADRVHVADIADAEALTKIVAAERPEYVLHLAAISFVLHGDVAEIYRTNIMGTRNLLGALAQCGHAPKNILLASSSNVYGNRNGGLLRESMPPDPVNDYSVSKVATEMVASMFSSQLPIVTARPFNYTGIGQSRDFLIPKIVDHVRDGAGAIKLGNLEVARDFSDVRFVVEAYCRLLEGESAIGKTVNVSSGRAYSLSEILAMIADITGRTLDVEVDPALVRENEIKQLWGDSSLLDSLVGPLPRVPLADTLRWMLSGNR